MNKRCFKCGTVKPIDDFYRHAQMADGRLNKCKECAKVDVRENRVAKIEHYRSFDKMRASVPHRVSARKVYAKTAAGKSAHIRANRKQRLKFPEKYQAKIAVNNAVRDGKLQKLPCFICGSENVEAHHPAYSMPLVVTWLCMDHHKEIHRRKEAA
jgi:hypothetical protein